MTKLMKPEQKLDNIRDLISRNKHAIEQSLPSHLTPERLMRVAFNNIQITPGLLECTPASLIGAILQCATLGLEPDGVSGQAYLVPFGGKVTLIIGYKGLMSLARRSGEISTIEAREVKEKDQFLFKHGTEGYLHHHPSLDANPGKNIAFYCLVKYKDGSYQFEVLSIADVERIRQRSKARESGPWKTDYDEMGKKTAVRATCKYLPFSVNLQTAIGLDERADVGIDQGFAELSGIVEPPPEKDKLGALTEQMQSEQEDATVESVADEFIPAAVPPEPPTESANKPAAPRVAPTPPVSPNPPAMEREKPTSDLLTQSPEPATASPLKLAKAQEIVAKHGLGMYFPEKLTETESMLIIGAGKVKLDVIKALEEIRTTRKKQDEIPF